MDNETVVLCKRAQRVSRRHRDDGFTAFISAAFITIVMIVSTSSVFLAGSGGVTHGSDQLIAAGGVNPTTNPMIQEYSSTYSSMVMNTDTIYGTYGQELAHESDSFVYTWSAMILSQTRQSWYIDTMYGGSSNTYTNGWYVSYHDYTGGIYFVISQWIVPNPLQPGVVVQQYSQQ